MREGVFVCIRVALMSCHNPYSGPLNLQLVGETPAVAFNWVGDVTKLSSGLCVCARARARVYECVEDERVCVLKTACACTAWDAQRIPVFRWVDCTFASESKRFGIVDCVCTALFFKKKLEVLESEWSVLVERTCVAYWNFILHSVCQM